jgi:phosphatidylinositol-3-phosphatase
MQSFRSAILLLCACVLLAFAAPASARVRTGPPPVGHVFVVVLENENADVTFSPDSPAPYLSQTLPSRGAFIPEYYGVTHLSLGNYVAMVSGQGSNPETQADCQFFTEFVGGVIGPDGQALGHGCVYPATVKTIADQLTARGRTWKGYMEDMGNDTTREAALCGHPAINTHDNTQTATPQDQYATRHNPFVYFHSIIDNHVYCEQHDVPLTQLPADLAKAKNTPNFSFITPDLCNDGHDGDGTPGSCADGGPGGLVAADAWLREWVPRITGSAAFKRDGLLLVTFDEAEAEGATADASACCNEAQFPNTPNNGGPVPGRGGGRVGAVALSPFIRAGTVTSRPYNHFSFLRSAEALLGLPFLGYAGSPDPGSFGSDVFTNW